MLRAVAFFVLIGLVSGLVAAEAEAPVEIKELPAREEFLILPLRVFRLQAKEFPAANTSLADADIERIVKKVNRVWGHAGITFGLESIREQQADVKAFAEVHAIAAALAARLREPGEKKPEKPEDDPEADETVKKEAEAAAKKAFLAERDSRMFAAFIPGATRRFEGFRVYYIEDFNVNGIYYGRREAMVKATAKLNPVPGGIDEPLPRVTSHELGHGLGLPHRQNRTNLMQSGTNGTTLNTDEAKTARGIAEKTPGVIRYSDLSGLIEKETDADRKALLQRWQKAVEEVKPSP